MKRRVEIPNWLPLLMAIGSVVISNAGYERISIGIVIFTIALVIWDVFIRPPVKEEKKGSR